MKFTDIPLELIKAHEEGKVVFFCGAGISYPAGLPLFDKLVDNIYNILLDDKTDDEKDAFNKQKYDTTLHLLELRTGRKQVKKALYKALNKRSKSNTSLENHIALLKLSQHNNKTKLVTTNYDRYFIKASKSLEIKPASFTAPSMPIADINLDGIVYLHGLLPTKYSENSYELEHTILTSGDFGRAYLVNAWATQFLVKLFRNYYVCFVGYSINDPILRYMTDALLAEKEQGESFLPTFAFIGCKDIEEEKDNEVKEWEKKGINCPIPYDSAQNHIELTNILTLWAHQFSSEQLGKKAQVEKIVSKVPNQIAFNDKENELLLYALISEDYDISEHFIKLTPPPILWLEYFFTKRLEAKHISLLYQASKHLQNYLKQNACKKYNLFEFIDFNIELYSIHNDYREQKEKWEKKKNSLHEWIYKNLDSIDIFFLIKNYENTFDNAFFKILEANLLSAYTTQKSNTKNKKEIEATLYNCWLLFLEQRKYLAYRDKSNFFLNFNQVTNLNLPLRTNFIEHFKPCILFKKYNFLMKAKDIAITIEFTLDIPYYILSLLKKKDYSFITSYGYGRFILLLQNYLYDSLVISKEVKQLGHVEMQFVFSLPSILSHEQNRTYDGLSQLVEYIRDIWLILYKEEPIEAENIAINWFSLDYQIFKRLALFAASQSNISTDIWVNWLLANDAEMISKLDYHTEVIRLIKTKSCIKDGDTSNLLLLETAIFEKFNSKEDKRYLKTYLSKLQKGNGTLSEKGTMFLDTFTVEDIKQSSLSERNEFTRWHECKWGGDEIDTNTIPRDTDTIISWLENSSSTINNYHEIINEISKINFQEMIDAILQLAERKIFYDHAIEKVIDVYIEKLKNRNKDKDDLDAQGSVLVANENNHKLLFTLFKLICKKGLNKNIAWSFACYIRALAEANLYRANIIYIYEKLTQIDKSITKHEMSNDFPSQAINNYYGIATEAIIYLLDNDRLNNKMLISDDLKNILTTVISSQHTDSIFGKVILAMNLSFIYKMDEKWTRENFVSLFDIQPKNITPFALWQGYLMERGEVIEYESNLSNNFLKLAGYISNFGYYQESYIQLISYITFTKSSNVFNYNNFPKTLFDKDENIDIIADELKRVIRISDRKNKLWKEYFLPFWQYSWKKDIQKVNQSLLYNLIRIAIEFETKFTDTLALFDDWLRLSIDLGENFSRIGAPLTEKKIHIKYPEKTLYLLGKIIIKPIVNDMYGIIKILDEIIQVDAKLKENSDYIKVSSLIKDKQYC